MCGIAGYVDFREGSPSRQILLKMAQVLRRRGPDAQGILVDGACGMAHARLSIIDLAGSPQPMRVGHSAISLVYNGELYNYRELRQELQTRGQRFDTEGDTEVLLRWVEREWHEALRRFDGMFGFAAWHRQRQTLLLGRDPIGVKPLFFATPAPGVLVFGSEVKALLEHPLVDRRLDLDGLRQALRFRAVYGHGSLYAGVRQLDPGCWLEFDPRGQVHVGRYFDLVDEGWKLRGLMQQMDEPQLIEHGRSLLESAVRKRLIADVPVGAFLSGGLDSSVITAVICRSRTPDEPTHTFSVGFAGDQSSELPYARIVSDTLGTRHTEVCVDEDDYIRLLAELSVCRDAPVSEPADVAVARMSDVARQQVKVVLSGEGADEVFAGYPKYGFANPSRLLRLGLRAVGPARASRLAGLLRLDRRRSLIAFRSIAQPAELDRLVQWFSYLDRATLQSLLPGLDWSEENWQATVATQRSQLARCNGQGTHLRRMQALDCLTWLPCNMLERGDRMTMAYGLEMRVPFLDKALAPFGLALEDRMKIRGRTLKWIVRRWADALLPPQIRDRRKWGFRVPLRQWFRGRLRGMLQDYLLASRGLCGTYGDRAAVESLLSMHLCGQADLELELWTLLAAEVWYQDVFRRSATCTSAEPSAAANTSLAAQTI
ncbi:asparagine synthase (glutamine-hydrolyzing) [Fontivita pretiosa]|uniref:asparagine synthase (glutamine-hydrolyzing) n=1 Tax=Fontivita pretiosa TaxID=2989684 RepID=UPI003D17B851